MSRLLSDLLGVEHRELQRIIARLEHMSLQPSVDVRLTAEIITQVREKTRRLGLDPSDTTPEELYFALLAKVTQDDEILRRHCGIKLGDTPAQVAAAIAATIQKLLAKDVVLTVQPAAVRKILKSVPPKKTMRILKFRSVEAVLKREDPYVLYALAKKIEDKTWHKQLQARLNRLQSRDVGEQPMRILSLPEAWIEKLHDMHFSQILHPVPELGSVVLLPSIPTTRKGVVFLTAMIILQATQKILIETFPYKLKTMNQGYESLIPDIATGNLHTLQPIHGMKLSWHAVYHAVATRTKEKLNEVDFIVGDLFWESSETRLSMISSELDFWVNTHYLGVATKNTVLSLHAIDCAASLVLQHDFSQAITTHLKASLWNELQIRYLEHESIENSLIPQLTMAQEFMV